MVIGFDFYLYVWFYPHQFYAYDLKRSLRLCSDSSCSSSIFRKTIINLWQEQPGLGKPESWLWFPWRFSDEPRKTWKVTGIEWKAKEESMCQCYHWTLHELTCHQASDENEKVDEDAANTVEECKTEITLEYISGLENANVFKKKLIMSSFNEGSLKEDNGKVLFYTT